MIRLLFLLLTLCSVNVEAQNMICDKMKTSIKSYPALPIKGGLSAPFAGISNNVLIVAGGSNFPDVPVADGGKKRYYSDIFALKLGDADAKWQPCGDLSAPIAYGASVSTDYGIVFIGGNNAEKSFSDVLLLTWDKQKCTVVKRALPSLPLSVDNSYAAYLDGKIYLAGGMMDKRESNNMLCLDLKAVMKGDEKVEWTFKKPFPGSERVQPVLAGTMINGSPMLLLSGGFQSGSLTVEPQLPSDVYVYDCRKDQWSLKTDLPKLADGNQRSLVGGSAVTLKNGNVVFFGGINRQIFYNAFDRPRQIKLAQDAGDVEKVDSMLKEKAAYMRHPVEWYKFNDDALMYDLKTNTFTTLLHSASTARAGAAAAVAGNEMFIVGGELKPGIRSDEVNALIVE